MRRLDLIIISTFWLLATGAVAQAQSVDFESWRQATPEKPYDITVLLQNPSGTENFGWQRNAADAAAGYNKRNTEFASSLYSGVGIESWYWTPVKNADLVWQDVEGVLPGTYRVTAYVVAQIYNDGSRKGQCGSGSYFFAGKEKKRISSNKWQELSVTCTVGDEPTLRIGILGNAANQNDWVSIAQVRVECLSYAGYSNLRTLVLDERYDVSVAREKQPARAVLYRTLSSTNYTPLCLPFDLTAAQTDEYFAEVLEVTGATPAGEVLNLRTKAATTISAAKPYLVRSRKDGRQRIEVSEVIISQVLNEAQPVILASGAVNLIGTFRTQEAMTEAWLPSADGRQLVRVQGVAKAKGYSFWGTISR